MFKNNVDKVSIRFLGDSGDGIQLIGNQFSDVSVIKSNNNIYTLVDYPAEIRAPSGSISGVSSFQVSISSNPIYSMDDFVDMLVVFNPAAFKVGLSKLKDNGILILDSESFNDRNLKKAGYTCNPIDDDLFKKYKIISVPITSLTYNCVFDKLKVVSKSKKCRNFFVLGIVCWIYDKDITYITSWLRKKFMDDDVFSANSSALLAGYNYCFNLNIQNLKKNIPASHLYSKYDKLIKISGNKAFSLGAVVSSFLFNLSLFSANYPITPASDVFQDLFSYANSNIRVFQVEDEIAAINCVIGAAYGGSLSFTCTSGPGLDLMQEGLGLAIMAELPILLLDIQRCGPSTGIPTKSEQTDLLAAIFGRHGESSLIVLAPDSPSNCFWTIIEAFCYAVSTLSPVIVLSDANLANSSELWKVPSVDEIKTKINFCFDTFSKRKFFKVNNELFDSRYEWVVPSESDLKCVGGLEKDFKGNVSTDAFNHSFMVERRSLKISNISNILPQLNIIGDIKGDVLIISWGSVSGLLKSIYHDIIKTTDKKFSFISLKYLNPLPLNFEYILKSFNKIIVVEENLGHLSFILRAKYCINLININQVTGKPFDFLFLKERIFFYL